MNFEWIKDAVLFVIALGAALSSVVLHLEKRKDTTQERIAKVEKDAREHADAIGRSHDKRLDEQANRITQLETQISGLPGHEELVSIREEISGLGKQLGSLAGKMEGLSDSIRLMLNKMMDGGGK